MCITDGFLFGKHRRLRSVSYTHLDVYKRQVLESTTYPGTTEELLCPILEKSGLVCGKDFFLAFSPERVDPGNKQFKTKNTPKVVGGVGPDSTKIAAALYRLSLIHIYLIGQRRCAAD